MKLPIKFKPSDFIGKFKNQCIFLGNQDVDIKQISTPQNKTPNSVIWIKNLDFSENIKEIQNSLIILPQEAKDNKELLKKINLDTNALWFCHTPKLTFIQLIQNLIEKKPPGGIEKTAIVSSSAQIHPSSYIGNYVIVGENVSIGKNCIIHPHVVIYDNVEIGDNVIIHANTTIGADGFGYENDESGKYWKFPHLGKVIIGNNVEIGANTAIDKGSLSDTIIGDGTKIDNLVHIAHNVKIGKNCMIIANSMIAGSVEIEDNAWIAPSSSILNQKKIGKNALIGMASNVVKDVPSNQIVAGNPARSLQDFKKIQALLKQLMHEKE